MGVPARLLARARLYGSERMPAEGGAVLAVNHLHWIDVPLVGVLSPRNLDFVAKFEAVSFPGLGRFLDLARHDRRSAAASRIGTR